MSNLLPQIMLMGTLFAILNGGPWTTWYSASAKMIVLPTELQGAYVISKIKTHFDCAQHGREITHTPRDGGVRCICCGSISQQKCFNDSEYSTCMEGDQLYYCGYRNAIVCQYEDGRGSCIYSNSSSMSIQPLCVCKENGTWPISDAHASQIRGSCLEIETTTSLSANSSKSDQTTGEVTIIAIVFGTILAIVLLVLLVVRLVKRRRNQIPRKKVTTSPTNSPDVSSVGRAQMQDPLVLGGTEYNYAYDHWPQRNPASNPGKLKPANRYEENEHSGSPSIALGNNQETQEVPKYYELGQSNDGRKAGETLRGPEYYEIERASNAASGGKTPQAPIYDEVRRRPNKEQRNTGKTPQDSKCFELEQLGYAAIGGKTPQAPNYDEVRRRSLTEQSSNEKTPQDPKYFKLEHPQDNDNETVFGEVDESANPTPGGFSNQGYDQAYNMPLQQTTKPPSAAEINDASSQYDHLNTNTGIPSQRVELPEKEDDDQYAKLNV